MSNDNTRKRKKAPNGAGAVDRRGATWWARISAKGKPRKRIPIPNSETMTETQARREARKLSADYAAGRIVFDDDKTIDVSTLTVRQVGKAWTSGELYQKHGAVYGLRPIKPKTGYIYGTELGKRVYEIKTRGATGPSFGDLPIASVTAADARGVMSAQRPEDYEHGTREKTYQRCKSIFDFAELPMQIRADGTNPFTKRLRPVKLKDVTEKAFQYLWPSESVQLSACIKVILARRVFYAIAKATGFDVSTLPGMTWAAIDKDRDVIMWKRPKTQKPIFVRARPAWLFDLLDAWREISGAPKADASRAVLEAAPIVPASMLEWECGREAEALRADLLLAGCDRHELHVETDLSHAMRFHDLRATFQTWARRDGWDQRDIDARTGHTSKEMADRYDRGARSLAELDEKPFPNLANAMPEIASKIGPVGHAVGQNGGPSLDVEGEVSREIVNDDNGVRRRGLEPLRCYPLAPQAKIEDFTGPMVPDSAELQNAVEPVSTPDPPVANGLANLEAALAESIRRGDDAMANRILTLLELRAKPSTARVIGIDEAERKKRGG